jgi:hypothetical protein
MKGADPLVKRESRSASFAAKVASCLWSADPSFMNSVTGSGYVAKCSNIQQDIVLNISEIKLVETDSSHLWRMCNISSYQLSSSVFLSKCLILMYLFYPSLPLK